MKRIILFAAAFVMVLCCLCACGEKTPPDITSKWKLYEMTTAEKSTKFDVLPAGSLAPKFSSKDGKSFTFSLNGKTHTGTLTENNGVYTLDFDDTTKTMEATISGDTLTLRIVGVDKIKMVFKAK
ncbi:MAG: lipocalin family protein [Oscillospiraceae bacterium]